MEINSYRGMIDLARRSGQIISIDARAVYDGDKFECVLGLDPKIDHVPDWQNAARADASKLRFVYAVAKLKDGGLQFDVMSRAEVEGIRARSKSADNGPWVTDFPAMALKTVVRRLFKLLPVSIEIQQAVGLDELAEHGLSQNNASVIDVDATFPEDTGAEQEPQDTGGGGDAPTKTYAQLAEEIQKASSADTAALVLDEARSMLPADQLTELGAVYTKKWGG